jgi:eukaryotic-like serine/threonine-protein kinase
MFEGNAATVIGRRVGNYVVERTLAQGGMGSVFVARHPALGREAAVKFLGQDFEAPPELTKRFLDEARITANLRHPNIVDIFDFGELDGRLYYVMELLDGRDLSALIRARRRFTCDEVADFLEQICSGLAAAHAVGVVHRDLKPGNIFVVRGDPPRLKLMDFGVAKIMTPNGEVTRYGQIIGTPRYMSPEQALGQIDRITPQSDIYSLGVIAYEMLTGVAPFEHDSPGMLLVMHVRDPVRPLQQHVAGVPPQLSELIESCLAKEPSGRPASAQEILDRIGVWRRQSRLERNQENSTTSDARAVIAALNAEEEIPLDLVAKERFVDADTVLGTPTAPTPSPAVERALELISQRESKNAAPTPSPAVERALELISPCEPRNGPEAKVVASMPAPDKSSIAWTSATAVEPKPSPAPESRADVHPIATTVNLTEADRTTLNRLLARMQRRGDFPAFVQNVGEVNKRADFEGSYSAGQLGTSILKDYALTAKLLRIVNSAYASRFGGKIYSVQHAIVILGFDRVRSLALSTSLFKNQGNKEHAERISESAINSLVSGEIARQIYLEADLDDGEQATVCSMFRNLGRHLVLVYLPELFDQIVALTQQEGISLNHASERVLGISLHKLGVGIAERWRLPQKMISAMSVIPERTGKLKREEDKLAALADFANQLCEIVASDSTAEERTPALKALLNRHKNLIHLEADDVTALLQTTQQAFEQRYSSLLGAATKTCRFARTVATLSGEGVGAEALTPAGMAVPTDLCEVRQALSVQPAQAPQAPQAPQPARTGEPEQPPRPARLLLTEPTPIAAPQPIEGGMSLRKPRAKPKIAPLQLGKVADLSDPSPAPTDRSESGKLDVAVAKALAEFGRSGSSDQILSALFAAIAQHLDVPRILALRAVGNRRELRIVGGIGDDLDGLSKEFQLPLSPARGATDPFSQSYHLNRDCFIEDVFAPKLAVTLPARYYEAVGSTSLAVLACSTKGSQPLVLLIDLDPPRRLPTAECVAQLGHARQALAKIVPTLAV